MINGAAINSAAINAPDVSGILTESSLKTSYTQYSLIQRITTLRSGYDLNAAATTGSLRAGYYQHCVPTESSLKAGYRIDTDVVVIDSQNIVSTRYTCILSDATNGDLSVSMQSFSLRSNISEIDGGTGDVTQTYLRQYVTISIPAYVLSDIALRSIVGSSSFKIEMHLDYANGTTESSTIAEVDYISQQRQDGAINRTMSIYGSRDISLPSGDAYSVQGVRQFSGDAGSGEYSMRTNPQFGLYPGMAVVYEGVFYTVTETVSNIGVDTANFDISLQVAV